MDRWSGHLPTNSGNNFAEYKPTTERSYRIVLLLVATTTFLSPLFALASFSGGWVIDNKGLSQDFNYTKLDMLNNASSGQRLPKVYNPDYEGPYFDHLPSEIRSLLIIGYVISLLANIMFPLKILGPWRFRCSGLPSFLYMSQGVVTLVAIISFQYGYLNKDIPYDRLVFSTSYYSAIISTVLSFVSALCLFIDYYLLSKLFKSHQGVGISPSLMVLSCCLVLPSLWCHVGAYAYEILEGWHPLLGFYFSLATITTIGFGDFRAETSGGRVFLFIHTLLGIVLMVGLASSVKSAFKEIFLSGKAERMRRKSTMANAPLDRYQTNNTTKTRNMYLDLGMLKTHLILALLNFILLWVLGALIFMTLESWPFFQSLYFSFVTFSTIGYGDIIIKTYPGLLAFSCYTIYGMVAMSYFISVVAEGWVQKFTSRSRSIEAGWWDKLDRAPERWPHLVAPPITSINNPGSPQSCEDNHPCSSLAKFLRRQRPKQETPDTPWQFQL